MATAIDSVTSALASFSLPPLLDNPNGWGPNSAALPSQFADAPFAPFNKSDRLGRVSDWNADNRRAADGRGGFGGFAGRMEDDQAFSLVDNRAKPKPRFRGGYRPRFNNNRGGRGGRGGWGGQQQWGNQRGGGQWGNQRGPQGQWGQQNQGQWGNRRGGAQGQWNNQQRGGFGGRRRWGFNPNDRQQPDRESSVEVRPEWKLVEDIDFDDLKELGLKVPEATDLVSCGTLEKYDATYDRASPKVPVGLVRFEKRQHFTATTSDDPVLQRLASENAGNVYATDTILGVLMTAPLSVNSWDIVVRKEGDNLYLDKRLHSRIDFLTVNENWNESQSTDKDSVNHPHNLSIEATFIGHNFSQQVLAKSDPVKFEEENPFLSALPKGLEPASVAYRYRRWKLSDSINLVSRCALNGFTVRGEDKLYLTIRALNEFDSKLAGNVDYRQKLESQPGAVLSSEMKNNATKLARWTAETVLSGADELKLGFVSRVNPKNSFRHTILLTQRYTPTAFAASINVKVPRLWGALRTILEACQKQPDGKYLLLKDANKSVLHLYAIPADAFSDEGAGDSQ